MGFLVPNSTIPLHSQWSTTHFIVLQCREARKAADLWLTCTGLPRMNRTSIRHPLSSQVHLSVTQSRTAALSQDCIWAFLGWCWLVITDLSTSVHQQICTSLTALLRDMICNKPIGSALTGGGAEHLLILWLLGIQKHSSPLGITQHLASPKTGNTKSDIFLCYVSANSCA